MDYRWRRQTGQPLRLRVRVSIRDRHSCPRAHFHQTFRLDRGVTDSGEIAPLYSGCHSRATSGYARARQWSIDAALPAQYGHPDRRMHRFATDARHSCSGRRPQRHHTRRAEPATTSLGVNVPLFVGCQSAAMCGWLAARESAAHTRNFKQNGQRPSTFERSCTETHHSCPRASPHFHQILRADPATTCAGVSAPFRVGCHCAARSGRRLARLLVTDARRPLQNGHPVAPAVRLFGDARHS